MRDFFVETEAVSGSAHDDYHEGLHRYRHRRSGHRRARRRGGSVFNELTNVDLIFGLADFFPVGPV